MVESAVVAAIDGATERVHAVLVLRPGIDPEGVVRAANATLADHQRIRSVSVWSDGALPRTEGTRKLKRAAIRAVGRDRRAAGNDHHGWRSVAGASGPVRRCARADRRDIARRPGAELARARRADGGARRSVSDAHRRDQVRRRQNARRPAGRGLRLAANRRAWPSRWTSRRGTARGPSVGFGGPANSRGSCRWRGCLRGRACQVSNT